MRIIIGNKLERKDRLKHLRLLVVMKPCKKLRLHHEQVRYQPQFLISVTAMWRYRGWWVFFTQIVHLQFYVMKSSSR